MYWPTPADYQEALKNPEISFQDIDLSKTKPNVLSSGVIEAISGAKVIVYHLRNNDRSWAIGCFLEPINEENNQNQLGEYLADISLLPKESLSYLLEGIKIKDAYYPIIKMDWVESKFTNDKTEANKALPLSTNQLELPNSKPTSPLNEHQTSAMDMVTHSLLLSEDPANSNLTEVIGLRTSIMSSSEEVFNRNEEVATPNIPPTQTMQPPQVPLPTTSIKKKGSDLHFTNQISLEESFNGTSVSIKIPKLETCFTCYGQGVLNGGTKCKTCKGQSKLITEKAFNINIPPGIKDGERLCMVGEGEASIDGGAAGDLYVNVLVRQHALFQREENNLYYTANITASQLGQNITILSLSGQAITFNVPFAANEETIIPIIGQGMPLVGENARGNLYIRINLGGRVSSPSNSPAANYQTQPPTPNYQNNYSYNSYAPNQANQNQPPRPYRDLYRDPSSDPSRSPYGSPAYYPQQNMQLQNISPNRIYDHLEDGQTILLQEIKTNAMLSFGLSVLSLFCLGVFIGPVSFFLSRKALHMIRTHNVGTDYKSWAMTGQILSIFSFILSGLMLLLVIFGE